MTVLKQGLFYVCSIQLPKRPGVKIEDQKEGARSHAPLSAPSEGTTSKSAAGRRLPMMVLKTASDGAT